MKFLILILSLILFTSGIVGISYGAITERGVDWATLDLPEFDVSNDEYWGSDQPITVTLTDSDMNKDPTVSEKIIFSNAYDYVLEAHPDLPVEDFMYKRLGSMPFFDLQASTNHQLIRFDDDHFNLNDQEFGNGFGYNILDPTTIVHEIFWDTYVSSGDSLSIEIDFERYSFLELMDNPKIKHFINYDFSSLDTKLSQGGINSFSITLEDEGGNSVVLVEETSNLIDYFLLDHSTLVEIKTLVLPAGIQQVDPTLKINLLSVEPNSKYSVMTVIPLTFDVFRFGALDPSQFNGDRELIMDSHFRLELEETGIDTGVFTGTIAWTEINIQNVDTFDYSSLTPFGKNIVFPSTVEYPYADHGRFQVNYQDSAPDGWYGQIADQIEINPSPNRYDGKTIAITTNEETPISVYFAVSGEITTSQHLPVTWSYDVTTGKHIVTPRENFFGTWSGDVQVQQIVHLGDEPYGYFQVPFEITVNPSSDTISLDRSNGLGQITVNGLSQQSLTVTEDTPLTAEIVSWCDDNIAMHMDCSGGWNTKQIAVNNPDLSELTFNVIDNPDHGTITGTTDIIFTPDLNYVGEDSMIVNFSDGTTTTENMVVSIYIQPVDDIPVANAGVDQSVDTNSVVSLDGSQSYDPDSEDVITYSWIQTAGDPVTLTDSTINNPQFTAPSGNGQVTFMLTVSDGTATSNPDVVNIYVGSLVPEATAPPAPTSLSSNPSDSTVVLNWQAPDDGGSAITDYVVEYKSANSSWSTYDDGVSSNTISIVSGLENNVSYQFRISAVNSVGTSDSSSLISATPISSTPIVETPIVETPIVETPIVETPIVETPITPEPTLGIASFVDTTKDPQSYVDRYNNEPTYKEWFDENYSQYSSIYEAIGLEEPDVVVEPTVVVEPIIEYIPEPTVTTEYVVEPVNELEITCGTGTIENKDGVCVAEYVDELEVTCGTGTESVNGICQVIQTTETSEGGGCLIATATYGSELAPQVQQLRELRDNQLLQTESGTAFMSTFNDVYYSFSPTIADMEREHPMFKEIVKVGLTPMISSLSLMENADSESEVLGIGISVIVLNLGMYLGVPAIVVVGIRKKF